MPISKIVSFNSGQTVLTIGTRDIETGELCNALARHVTGDWGIVSAEDGEENDNAVLEGQRILSAYMIDDVKIWIITEADRSVTTILLPEEY